MATVNFQCGHCSNLMAVTENLLGQQVRCPHCQQVVRAPVSAAPPPPPPPPDLDPQATTFALPPPPLEQESIFGPTEEISEDLFGSAPPQIELPPETAWAPPPPRAPLEQPPAPPPPAPPAPEPPPSLDRTVTYMPPSEATTPDTQVPALELGPGAGAAGQGSTLTAPAGESLAPTEPAGEPGLPGLVPPPVTRPRKAGASWVIPVLIVPLISYSILATVALALAYLRPPPPHPLENIPDQGDNPGASHMRQKQLQKIDFHQTPLLALPPQLKVPLGQSVTVGDLKVTPEKVELRKVVFRTVGFARPEPSTDDCLLLWLDLENVSQDVVFRPMDRFFNRHWKQGTFESNMPFSYVEMGGRRFYGGPELDDRTTIDGQNYETVLKPGERMKTFVCTDPDAHVGNYLAGYKGPLVYRVRFRRGLVRVGNREVSATAVIGVDFSAQDVTANPTAAG
jgi:hypothetical protein